MKSDGNARAARSAALLACLAVAAAPAGAATSSWIRNPQSAVRLITPYASAPRSAPVRLGVEFQLSPGWHAYWKNPGSAGFAPSFESQTAELRILEVRWPAPSRFELPGDLVAFGYERDVVYPLRGLIQASGDNLRVVVGVDYLVCEDECVPYRYDLTLDQPLADPSTVDAEGDAALVQWEARVPTAAASVGGVTSAASLAWRDDLHGTLKLTFGGIGGDPAIFFETNELFDLGTPARAAGDTLAYLVPIARRNAGRALPHSTDVAWTLTGARGAAANLDGRLTVELASRTGLDWRWVLGAAVLVAALVALFSGRRPAAGHGVD